MPNPLEALRKAATIGAAPPTEMEPVRQGFEGLIEGLRGAIGGVIPGVDVPESTAGHLGELAAVATPLFKLPGGRVISNVGGTYMMKEGNEAVAALNKLKPTGPTNVIKGVEELGDVTAAAPKYEVPQLLRKSRSGSQSTSWKAQSRLIPQDILDIRKRAATGEDYLDVAKDYPQVKPVTLKKIMQGEGWNWVK